MFWGNHMGYGGYGLFLTAALWIGLIVLGVWLLAKLFPGVSNVGSRGSRDDIRDLPRTTRAETAMEILQKRYARGELTKEEYETIRHDLST